MPLALLALAIGAFGIGTTEFVIMGVLPQVAGDLGVSIPTAGHLISGYALGVVVGAPLLTALSVRLSRKTMLLGMMTAFTLGNLLSALAPGYGWLLAARVFTALQHGAFFGVGAVVAAGMVAPNRRARAISMMFLGLTLANVAGVPLGTLLGQHLGWRATFLAVAGIGLVALVAITALVPRQPVDAAAGVVGELRAFRRPQVWLALALATLGFGGVFACYSYIAPMMTQVAGYSPTAMTGLLVLFGVGATVGNVIGGRMADRALMPSLYVSLGGLAVVLALFTLTAHNQVTAAITLFLVGAISFLAVPTVQTRIMDKAVGAPTLAAAANHSAFNIANAGGAYLGGLVIDAGFGYTSPNLVGAGLAVVGLVLAAWSGRLDRRTPAPVREPELVAVG